MHRLQAETHARNGEFELADTLFSAGLDIARFQKAMAIELRVTTTYARFIAERGEVRRGLQLLESMRDRVDEGRSSPDFLEAENAIARLRELAAEPDESVSSPP